LPSNAAKTFSQEPPVLASSAFSPGARVAQTAFQRAQLQEQMAGRAELDVGGAGDRRPRRDQVLGVEQAGAGLALVAAGGGAAAMGTGAGDVAIGQEAAVGR